MRPGWLMRLPLGFPRKYVLVSGGVLTIIWFSVFLRQFETYSSQPESTHIISSPLNTDAADSQSRLHPAVSSHDIITDAFDFPPVDSTAIKDVCARTTWNPKLVFSCDNSFGGIGNVRNSILHCVRFAIAGGGALIVPRIVVRNSQDIAEIRTGERAKMEYMFDTDHFMRSLEISCPQLRIHTSTIDEVPGQDLGRRIPLFPESLITMNGEQKESWQHVMEHPEQWRGILDEWLSKENVSSESNNTLTFIELERSYLQYPIYSDGEDFAHTFGGILKFRSEARILATKALLNLKEKYSLPIDFSNPEPTPQKAFLAVHLRTEKDAQVWGGWEWGKYERQSQVYLEQAAISNLSLVYVASGDLSEVDRFAADAANFKTRWTTPFKITAISKKDLFNGTDSEQLNSLAFDQQGMVDFLVMLKASDFAGIGHSSFAWNIALKRHLFAKRKEHLDGPLLLSDELSLIYGSPKQYPEYAAAMWP